VLIRELTPADRAALALARELGHCTVVSSCANVVTLMVEL